jgi:dienelactone hydrolase
LAVHKCHDILLKTFVCFIFAAILGADGFVQPSVSAKPPGNEPSADHPRLALAGTDLMSSPIPWDIRERQRQQIIEFFTNQIASSPARRDKLWRPVFSSPAAYEASIAQRRSDLRRILGLTETKLGTAEVKVLQDDGALRVEDLTVPIDGGLSARALLLIPHSEGPVPALISVPPENASREEFAGIVQGMTPARWLTALLERKVAVAIPVMTERTEDHTICRQAGGRDRRRVLWRAGFIVGRTLVGLEVQQVIGLRDYLASRRGIDSSRIGVVGIHQGGMTALYAGAVDPRLAAIASLDYFEQREHCWEEPVDRVIYGQLNEFGDAELAALIAPRPLLIVRTPGGGIPPASVRAEFARAHRFYDGLRAASNLNLLEMPDGALELAASRMALLLDARSGTNGPAQLTLRISPAQVEQTRNQNFEAVFQYLQSLIAASDEVRKNHWQLNPTPPQGRQEKVQRLRAELADLVGSIPLDSTALRPRTALIGETDKFVAYDVLLDVLPGVEAYGQLLVPRAVAGGVHAQLPAVVCQHGFDGAPKYITGMGTELEGNDHFYHRFGERLAERGYVVFAPYLSVPEDHRPPNITYRADLVNPLVRLAAPLGWMRTSIELTKLHRVIDFLQSLPFVDPERIGYYGLSYGGYSAIWMPPLEPRLKLTIISAHFNDWHTMLTDATRLGASYWTLPDEDFYNWNVLNRFVHTELIAAMWPRPVCIEYGSDDPVTTPEWHERAWKQVKAFSDAWGLDYKIVDDKFAGPHAIHGIGTFFFLDRWLRPEIPAGRDYGCRDDDYCNQSVAPGFHGYSSSPLDSAPPYATRLLDSSQGSVIRGEFYVSSGSEVFTGMRFKLARRGDPGDAVVRFGSTEGAADLGETKMAAKVYSEYDLWYEARLLKPLRLDPARTYYFELRAVSGQAPRDGYTVFGPAPLDGKDYPSRFGLSFRTLTRNEE